MINNDVELGTTQERIRSMQNQIAVIRRTETNPINFRLSVSGYISEIDRMQLEIREYLSVPADAISVGES